METVSAFKFATIRNATNALATPSDFIVMPQSPLIVTLASVNESESPDSDKLAQFNQVLRMFLDGPDFIKTKKQFSDALTTSGSAALYNKLYDNMIARAVSKSNASPIYKMIADQLRYEHVLLKNTAGITVPQSSVKILIPDSLVYSFTGGAPATADRTLAPPQSLTPSISHEFANYTILRSLVHDARSQQVVSIEQSGKALVPNPDYEIVASVMGMGPIFVDEAQNEIVNRISASPATSSASSSASAARAAQFRVAPDSTQVVPGSATASVTNDPGPSQLASALRVVQAAKQSGITTIDRTMTVDAPQYRAIPAALGQTSIAPAQAESLIEGKLAALTAQILQGTPGKAKFQIGQSWVELSLSSLGFVPLPPPKETSPIDNILVYDNGCWLKFPFQVADLRVVERQTVGYLPGEIALIKNSQPGGLVTQVTRHLSRMEESTSLLTETDVTQESETDSTEKFGFERQAAQVQSEEASWNVNASASAQFGPVKTSVDGGYDSSTSVTNSNSTSQTYAKEIVQKVVNRVSTQVRAERSTKTLDEIEDTVTHVIDNSKNTEPHVAVYRFLDMLIRGTLKNYGKRLIFQIDVAHPSHYYLSRLIDQPQAKIELPPDPRKILLKDEAGRPLSDPHGQAIGLLDSPLQITRSNYLIFASYYNADVKAPPPAEIVLSKAIANTKPDALERQIVTIAIPEGYIPTRGAHNGTAMHSNALVLVGASTGFAVWNGIQYSLPNPAGGTIPIDYFVYVNGGGYPGGYHSINFRNWSGDPTSSLGISANLDIVMESFNTSINFEIVCELTNDAFAGWQSETYKAIITAYENAINDAAAQTSNLNPTMPGLTAEGKIALIQEELKKESLRRMFRCNPFSALDAYVVGREYQSDCCNDSTNGERARFLETVFDWQNMTYEFYPYFYGTRIVQDTTGLQQDNWAELQKLSDDDPHFEAFLRASYATVRIPVFRDTAKETAAVNFIHNNSLANVEVVPEGMQSLLGELALEPVSKFSYDLDGQPLALPTETVDLGLFPLPTGLIILENGLQNGVKPRGFPESTAAPSSDVIIPKEYSPAIIQDTDAAGA